MECVRQSVVSWVWFAPEEKKKTNIVVIYIMHIRLIDCLQTSSDASHYTAHAHICSHAAIHSHRVCIAHIHSLY